MNNFNTLITTNKKVENLTFSDFPIFKKIYLSSPNLLNKIKTDNIYQKNNSLIYLSEARISLDNLGEEILNKNNDNFLINLQLEESNSNHLIIEKKKKVKEKNKNKIFTKLNLTTKKNKNISKSVNVSPLNNTKKINNKVERKEQKKMLKVKNVNKFINKPSNNKINSSQKSFYSKSKILNTKYKFPKNLNNIDKVFIEYQNIFGENFERIEYIYDNMTELDKKNCILSLINYISELKKSHKDIQERYEEMKKQNENKEKLIKDVNKQINILTLRNKNKSINLSTEESYNDTQILKTETIKKKPIQLKKLNIYHLKPKKKSSSLPGSKILSSKK